MKKELNDLNDALLSMFKSGVESGINGAFDHIRNMLKQASKDDVLLSRPPSELFAALIVSLDVAQVIALKGANDGYELTKAGEQMSQSTH